MRTKKTKFIWITSSFGGVVFGLTEVNHKIKSTCTHSTSLTHTDTQPDPLTCTPRVLS